MNNKKIYGAIAITFIVAVLALFIGFNHKSGGLGASSTATTNLPSLGLASLQVGSGCDQAYGTCTPVFQITSGGVITTTGVSTNTGPQLATTTAGASQTLVASDLTGYTSIVATSTFLNAASTITLPASSTLAALVPAAGNRRTIHFVNATSTALNITFAGNTGTILQTASSTKIVRGNGGSVDLDFYRPGTTTDAIGDIYVTLTNFGF